MYNDNFGDSRRIILGDLIGDSDFSTESFDNWLQKVKGNFICISINQENVEISSSVFSILPIFYLSNQEHIWVSDRLETLVEQARPEIKLCREHLLERLFFNYTLTDRTWVQGIRQFPSNSVFSFQGSKEGFRSYLNLFDLYDEHPQTLKESRQELVDLFSRTVQRYLPSEKYASAFTGGFDGRCVVAAGLNSRKKFESYSFGISSASDVDIPKKAAAKIGFDYKSIDLNSDYLKYEFRTQGEEMVNESNGMSTISRAHYRFGAILLSKRFKYLLSGNFGSELFRSAHLDGVMTSNVFYSWLKDGLPENINKLKEEFAAFDFLNEEEFAEAYDRLRNDLVEKRSRIPSIPLNAQLYFLMWTDTLRNYFGSELSMQQKYLVHRSPFLDFEFFKALQGTEYSGAFGNFRERNLAKRIKGQLFYAHFLRKNSRGLFKAITGKGYRPSDITNLIGLIRVSFAKLLKAKNPADQDPLLANQGFNENKAIWSDSLSDWTDLFSNFSSIDSRSLQTLISGSFYLKHLQAKRDQP